MYNHHIQILYTPFSSNPKWFLLISWYLFVPWPFCWPLWPGSCLVHRSPEARLPSSRRDHWDRVAATNSKSWDDNDAQKTEKGRKRCQGLNRKHPDLDVAGNDLMNIWCDRHVDSGPQTYICHYLPIVLMGTVANSQGLRWSLLSSTVWSRARNLEDGVSRSLPWEAQRVAICL